jgi:uncharacterized protein (TIGR00251 family)
MKVPYKKTEKGITVRVKVRPRSSRKGIGGVAGGVVKVYLTSPPVDGAANEQLIEVLSKELKVRKGAVRILKGLSSRDKIVAIDGVEEL